MEACELNKSCWGDLSSPFRRGADPTTQPVPRLTSKLTFATRSNEGPSFRGNPEEKRHKRVPETVVCTPMQVTVWLSPVTKKLPISRCLCNSILTIFFWNVPSYSWFYDISPLSVRLSLSRLLALAACTAAVPLPSIFCLLTEDNKKNTASHSLTALTIFFSCTVAQPALSAGTKKSKSTNIAWEVNHTGTIVFFY